MDLLASSCCSVLAAAVGKAIEIWAAWRQFGGVDNSQFAALPILQHAGFSRWQNLAIPPQVKEFLCTDVQFPYRGNTT